MNAPIFGSIVSNLNDPSLPSKAKLISPSWRSVIPYLITFVGLGMSTTVIGPSLPWLAEKTNVGLWAIGFLFTARALGYLCTSTFAGKSLDKRKSHPMIASALLGIAICYALVLTANLYIALLSIFFMIGAFGSFVDIGGNVMTLQSEGDNPQMRVNALHFFFGIGTLLSPLIISYAFDKYGSLEIVFPTIAAFTAIAMLIVWSRPSPRIGRVSEHTSTASLSDPRIWRFLVFIFLIVATEVSVGAWIFTYAIKSEILSNVQAGLLTSLFFGAFTLGRLLSIPIAKHLKPEKLLPILFAVGLVFAILLISFGSQSALLLRICTLGFGFALSAAFPSSLSYISEHIQMSGTFTSWIFIAANLSALTIPALIGVFADSFGLMSILVAFVILFLAVNISFLMTQRALKSPNTDGML